MFPTMRIELFGEPGAQHVTTVHFLCSEYESGNIIGDLNSRRGIVNELGTRQNLHVVNASVPLAEMFSYIAELRNLSKGRANYSASVLRFNTFQLSKMII
jgi:elongation factor G